MPIFGDGNPETLLCTRWVAMIKPGPAYNGILPFLEQPYITQHLKNYHVMLRRGELLMGGPFTNLNTGFIVFGDRVSSYKEARAIMDRDPSIANGVMAAEIDEWFTLAIGGGKCGFFAEDSVVTRQAGELLAKKGFGGLLGRAAGSVIGEVSGAISAIVNPGDAKRAAAEGRKFGEQLGGLIGGEIGEAVVELQGSDSAPRDPDPDPDVEWTPSADLPNGTPLPYMVTRWAGLITMGHNYNGTNITLGHPSVEPHLGYMENEVISGQLLLGGPATNFARGWLIWTEEVTTYEEALVSVRGDIAHAEEVLHMEPIEWFTNVRKGESTGYFDADKPHVRAAGDALKKAGFFGDAPEYTGPEY